MLQVQQGCGLRRAELIGLLRDDVDMDARVLHVTGQSLPNGARVDYAKTADSLREVPLRDELVDLLRAHLDAPVKGKDHVRLFTNPRTRRPWTHYSWGTRVGVAVEATPGIHPNTSSHDLRHGAAVELLNAGLPAHLVGRFLGHSTAKEVLQTYSAYLPTDDDAIRNALDKAWARQHALTAVG